MKQLTDYFNGPPPLDCYSYKSETPGWQDISQSQTFWHVATNPASDAIWGVLQKSHKRGKGA